jgi:hypothetical protein
MSFDFTSAVLDSRVNFTRSTSASNPATYIDSGGLVASASNNQPRFDYNLNTGGACKGLLIEESRTNLITYSSDFSNAAWTKVNATITADFIVSPDGTMNADRVVFASGSAEVTHNYTVAAGTSRTASMYVKGTAGQTILVGHSGGGSTSLLLDGTWQRVASTGTAGTKIFIGTWGGSTARTVYIWGAQLEAGAFATSYIPTTTTALTRNADVATMTGTNFSDFWQATKGGASVLATPSTVSGIRPLVQFDDNTANEIIALRGNTTNPELYIVDGGTPQAQLDAGTIAANTAYSLTGWWQTNFCAARKDNGARVEDLTATIPIVTQARLGSDGTNYLNGHLATINYYDQFSGQIYTRRKNKVIFNVI